MRKLKMLSDAMLASIKSMSPHRTLRLCFLLFLFFGGMMASRTANAQIIIDGNPNDWPAGVFSNPAVAFKTFVADPFNTTSDDVYTMGGSKDVNDIPQWRWELQAANDKTDMENAGMALIGSRLYFFGDHYANTGAASIGIWILKNEVNKLPLVAGLGSFSGVHADGDVLVTTDLAGGHPERHAYVWTAGALVEITLSTAAFDIAVNTGDESSPWPYTPKSGTANVYPESSFMEGFVDLDSLGVSVDFCFTEFFMSTRTSQSTSAQLEDLVRGLFATRPVVTVANDTVCAGQPATFIAHTIGGLAPITWAWNGGAFAGDSTFTINPATVNTVVTVVAQGANGCFSEPDTAQLVVKPSPSINAISSVSYCNGQSASAITFSSTPPGASFSWTSSANVGFGTSGTGSIGAYTATNTGATPVVATVSVTATSGGCPGSPTTFNVTVNPTPNVAAHGDSSYCAGASAPGFSFSGSVAGTSFSWTASTNVGFGVSGTGNIPGFTATNGGSTALVATVIVTPSANGCPGVADTFIVTVNPTPNVAAHGDSTYCSGVLAAGLNFSGSVGGTTFTWVSSANVGFGTSGTGNIPAYSATNGGLVAIVATVTVTPSLNGCSGTPDVFMITVNPNASINPVTSRSLCRGGVGTAINFSGSLPGLTFSWVASVNVGFGTSGTGSIGTYTATNAGATPVVATVTVTPSVAGCGTGVAVFMVTVNPTPNVVAHGDSTYCKGITAPGLNFTGAVAGTTFVWTSSANVGFGTSGTGNIPPYLTLNPGSTNLVTTVIVTPSANGCPGTPDTFLITINPAATVPYINNVTLCSKAAGGPINITGGDVVNIFTWSATTNVGFGTAGTGNIGAFTAINNPGPANIVSTVTVTVAGGGGCAGSSRTFKVTILPKPIVVARDTTLCAGTSLNLIPMGTPAGGTWSGPGVSGSTFNTGTPGTYKIYYNVNNGAGCSGYDSAYICVTQCCVVYGTYTQGVWGSCYGTVCDGKTNCSGRKTSVQLINYLLSSGQITVGRPGRSVIIPTYAAATVNAVMPGGYSANKLTYAGNVTINNTAGSIFAVNYLSGGKLKNSLLAEQIAMKLNTRMTAGLVNFPIIYTPGGDSYFQTFQANEVCCKFTCSDMCPTCFSIKKSVAKYLTKGGTQSANLNSLINLADDLLGGVLTPGATVGGYVVPSYADVAAALGTISSAFNYFRTFNGGYGCGAAKGAIASGNTSTESPTIEGQTRIYPNPTTGVFTVEVPALEKDAHVTVLDINGRSLLTETLPANPYEQKLQLQMPEVARGMYFIRIETDGKLFTKKLMLE
jgi:hypothetical protein